MSPWQTKCTEVLIGKIPIIYETSQKVQIKYVKSKQGLEYINGEILSHMKAFLLIISWGKTKCLLNQHE